MTTLKPCVQKMRSDGLYPVYIRVTHDRKVGYIKTDKMVAKKGVTKSKEIKDNFVLNHCTQLILDFTERLNKKDTSTWTIKEVIDFLVTEQTEVCFSDYARKHISRMINKGEARNARNYQAALSSIELFLGSNQIMFTHLTSAVVNRWIVSLDKTKRAKEMYPICIRQIFRAAILEYNDYDTGNLRIKTNPWMKVKIPSADKTEKKAISPEACRDFFSAPLPESKMIDPLPELSRDVVKMVLCLAGINTVDIYHLQKSNYHNGVICYKRAKTRNSRRDEAYIEMRVEPIIQPLFEKYKADDDDPFLFNFHVRHSTYDSFSANVNSGLKKICKSMGIPESDWYCVYTFRHTWGTVAQNDCDASISEVGFAMNHTHGHTVTRGYIKIDFTPAWELNAKVINFIFFSDKTSKQGKAIDIEDPKGKLFRLSPKMMVLGKAYYKGKVLAEIQDIGFGTIEQVISLLASALPDTIPTRGMVSFSIKNMDSGREAVYERMKGKGF